MAFTIDIFDTKGKKLKTQDLDAAVFAQDNINDELIYQYILWQRNLARKTIASTKTRGEVIGSGKKLYRQKGTGSARVGDKKSPIRVAGGVARGPRSQRNFVTALPKKMRKAGMRSALSLQASKDAFIGLEGFDPSVISTKAAASTLEALKIERKVLVVVTDPAIAKSYRNLPFVRVVSAAYLGVEDVLRTSKIILVGDALDRIIEINK